MLSATRRNDLGFAKVGLKERGEFTIGIAWVGFWDDGGVCDEEKASIFGDNWLSSLCVACCVGRIYGRAGLERLACTCEGIEYYVVYIRIAHTWASSS